MKRLLSLTDTLVPRDHPDAQRLRIHVRVSLGLALFGLVFSLIYLATGAPTGLTVLVGISSMGGIGVVIATSNGMSLAKSGACLSALMWLAFSAVAYHYQGLDSMGPAWLTLVPTIAMAMGNRTAAKWSFAASLATFAGLLLLHQADLIPASFMAPELERLVVAVNLPVMMLLSVGLMALANKSIERRTERLEEANTHLREEVQQRILVQTDLETTRAQLVDAARNAGRAEVATGALHNIGNALNSVNVAAAQAQQILHRQRTKRVNDLGALVADHDPRLQEFATRLGDALERDRAAALREIGELISGLEHVAQVVAAQQSFARHRGVEEPMDLGDTIRQAALLVDTPPGVSLEIDDIGPIEIVADRHRVLQILANLIKNAGDACGSAPGARIQVAMTTDASSVRIDVIDNGHGIEAELLQRIFAHGFTTKSEGSGFGLHASALAARELGGQLTAASDGRDAGARFSLVLPYTPTHSRAAV